MACGHNKDQLSLTNPCDWLHHSKRPNMTRAQQQQLRWAPFGHNRHRPKIGEVSFLGGAGSPSNTMLPGPRPTPLPSGILIHLAVWPQQTRAENWELCALLGGDGGKLVPCLTQSRLGPSLPPYQVETSSIQPFGHEGRVPKIGGLFPLLGSWLSHLAQSRLGRGLPACQVLS